MPNVKVWNLNSIPHVEEFKGNKIRIEPQSFIEMEYYEAYEFKGKYFPMIMDQDGKPKVPESYKKIHIEAGDKIPEMVHEGKNVCIACKYKAQDEKDLIAHINASHAHQLVKDEEAEKFVEEKKKKKTG